MNTRQWETEYLKRYCYECGKPAEFLEAPKSYMKYTERKALCASHAGPADIRIWDPPKTEPPK